MTATSMTATRSPMRSCGAIACLCLCLSAGCAELSGSDGGGGDEDVVDTASEGAETVAVADNTGCKSPDKAPPPATLGDGPAVEAVVDKGYFDRAREVIRSAASRLDIVQFEVVSADLIDILVDEVIAAHNRGVAVRVLLDDEVDHNVGALAKLKAACVPAKIDSDEVRTHAKIVWSEQALLIGSTNWSHSSVAKNNETNLLVRHKRSRNAIGGYIDSLWNNSAAPAKLNLSNNKLVAVYGDGGYAKVVGPLIDAAAKRIWIVTYSMNLDPKYSDGPIHTMAGKLAKAVKRGVDVRVIFDRSGDWNALLNKINATSRKELEALGIPIRQETEETITHAKFLVADDTLVLGTNNWGYGGFQLYHEAGIRTSVAAAVKELADYHEALWKISD